MYYMHEIIDLLAILDIHKNLVPNCGMWARYLLFRKIVWCKPVLDRKFDRNADTLQRTITDVGEQDPAPGATGRTATNSHGQSMPYPFFATTCWCSPMEEALALGGSPK